MLEFTVKYLVIGFLIAILMQLIYGGLWKIFVTMRTGVPARWYYPYLTFFWLPDMFHTLYYLVTKAK